MKSAEMIGWAIGGIEREIVATRERLTALTTQANALRAKLPGGAREIKGDAAAEGAAEGTNGRRKRRRNMSPEARRRISEMMTQRWEERRKAAGQEAKPRKRKGGISPEGRKRISEMMKKRWAERRKAAK